MNVWKLPQDAPMDVRVRMNTLSLATVTLGQSPSFWAGGTDLLRSKSMDRDSYDSGDHFNTIDWMGQSNGFGRGLPPEEKNGEAWDLMTPMLEDPAKSPTPQDIALSSDVTLDLLRIRSSSPLFTLGDADLITQKVTFPNAGADATAGLLVMRIDDTVGEDVDPALDGLVTVFNASDEPITEAIDGMAGIDHRLHEVQADGADEVVKGARWDAESGTVTIPAHTVAVFVAPQADGGEGPGDGEEPGDGDAPGDGEEPGDGEQPGEGGTSGDGEQPGDGGAPDEGDAPGEGEPSAEPSPASPAPGADDARSPLAKTGLDLLPWAAAVILTLGLGIALTARARSRR